MPSHPIRYKGSHLHQMTSPWVAADLRLKSLYYMSKGLMVARLKKKQRRRFTTVKWKSNLFCIMFIHGYLFWYMSGRVTVVSSSLAQAYLISLSEYDCKSDGKSQCDSISLQNKQGIATQNYCTWNGFLITTKFPRSSILFVSPLHSKSGTQLQKSHQNKRSSQNNSATILISS